MQRRSSVEAILAVKGVLETIEASESEAEAEAKTAVLMATLDQAFDGVVAARSEEGRRLQKVLLDQVTEIERITNAIETSPSRSVASVKRRIAEQVAKLVDSSSILDPARLHQEAVLLATKADVEEELKRLHAHIAAARDLLQSKDGRWPQARFPIAGIQSRGQYDMLENERFGDDHLGPVAQVNHRAISRAGAEH